MKLNHNATATLLALFVTSVAGAQDNDNPDGPRGAERFTPGFSGYVGIIAGPKSEKSHFNTEIDKTIVSTNDKAKSDDDTLVGPLFELNYTLSNRDTQLFIGTPEKNIVDQSYFFEMGVRHMWSNGSIVTFGYLPRVLDKEVWADPYQLNTQREETDSTSDGIRLALDMGLVEFDLMAGRLEVDKENSGLYLANNEGQALTDDDVASLTREGDIVAGTLTGRIPLNDNFFLSPSISYIGYKPDGSALEADKIELNIKGIYLQERSTIVLKLGYGQTNFDNVNPIFGVKRENDNLEAGLVYDYQITNTWSTNIILNYSESDSNIDFYDSEDSLAAVGFTYRFGDR